MPAKKEPFALLSRVQTSFQQLSTAASTLNAESDQLTKQVAELDSALKPLNVGLVCWIDLPGGWTSPDHSESYSEQVGYAKVGGKWGISIRTVKCWEFAEESKVEEYAFNDAPRRLRLAAVDYIPELLEALVEAAAKATERISRKTAEVQQLVAAVRGSIIK